jgi:hypothetical protein
MAVRAPSDTIAAIADGAGIAASAWSSLVPPRAHCGAAARLRAAAAASNARQLPMPGAAIDDGLALYSPRRT